jgi:hypothetical protein
MHGKHEFGTLATILSIFGFLGDHILGAAWQDGGGFAIRSMLAGEAGSSRQARCSGDADFPQAWAQETRICAVLPFAGRAENCSWGVSWGWYLEKRGGAH